MKITIVGTGYVGLVTGVCFADIGYEVTCLDIDQERVQTLQKGLPPIYEIGLQDILTKNLAANRLRFTSNYESAVKDALFIFLTLPTPTTLSGECDISYIKHAVETIAQYMDKYCLIITKSTVSVGTGAQIEQWIQEALNKRKTTCPFDVVSNPEFLQEGKAIENFMQPDRVIIGVKSVKAEELMRTLYQPFLINGCFLVMDIPTAEMSKYASNAMLACRISFINELATLCEKTGVDIQNVRLGLSKDKRIGSEFLSPGVGFGGSCFPKDLRAIRTFAKKNGVQCQLLDAIFEVNERQKALMAYRVEEYFSGFLQDKILAIWGLSFKPDTDDIREAPAFCLIEFLVKKGAKLRLFDPMAMNAAKKVIKSQVYFAKNELDAIEGADAVILMTEWKEFRSVEFSKAKMLMRKAVFFDGRNLYDPIDMEKHGFEYFCIGRPKVEKEAIYK